MATAKDAQLFDPPKKTTREPVWSEDISTQISELRKKVHDLETRMRVVEEHAQDLRRAVFGW